MPTTLTRKNIPDEVYKRLRAADDEHRRSLNREAVVCLEAALIPRRVAVSECLARARARRRGTISLETARAIQPEAESLLAGGEHEVDSRLVLELVRDSACSAYDCEFVALARTLGVKLVTLDRQLLKAFSHDALPLPAA